MDGHPEDAVPRNSSLPSAAFRISLQRQNFLSTLHTPHSHFPRTNKMRLTTYLSLLALLSLSLAQKPHGAATSAYDALQSHGLPRGLLPCGITSFTVNASTARFEATLDSPCTAKFESDVVHYNTSISGTLSYGEIASLSGVSAQELFLWFPVLGIKVDVSSSRLVYFDVGVVYKMLPLSLFESPPLCTPDDSSPSISTFDLGDAKHASTL
ncbi:hypothetical protein LUZ62_049689 [Rhynchospora pubera]|uniref:Uncharacterized protein n=1 Tax=Rhynchospora pubera TaxID=906938 RepID=A0AAV8G5Q7_9POAL|nr:hypothetical protein LUZ62_049689 [Rhynchospora pubera]